MTGKDLYRSNMPFDHDGTISHSVNEGRDYSADDDESHLVNHDDADESLYENYAAQVIEFVDKTTNSDTCGIRLPTGLVKEFDWF